MSEIESWLDRHNLRHMLDTSEQFLMPPSIIHTPQDLREDSAQLPMVPPPLNVPREVRESEDSVVELPPRIIDGKMFPPFQF